MDKGTSFAEIDQYFILMSIKINLRPNLILFFIYRSLFNKITL